MRRFTNKSINWRGNTTVVTARFMNPIVEELDKHVGKPDLPNRSSILQDALARWLMAEEENHD